MRWWAVYSEYGRELAAARALTELGVRALCPFERVTMRRKLPGRHSFRARKVERPLFNRYLFTEQCSLDTLRAVRGIHAVLCLPGREEPMLVGERDMSALLNSMVLEGEDAGLVGEEDLTRLSLGFGGRVGDRFEFSQEAPTWMWGQQAKIVSLARLDSHGEVQCDMQIFGRSTEVKVDHQSVGNIVLTAKIPALAQGEKLSGAPRTSAAA